MARVVCLLVVASVLRLADSHLELFKVYGSFYDKGFQLGNLTRAYINENMRLDPSLPQLLNWSQSDVGAPIWGRIWERQVELYPDYVEEVRGMADGADVSFLEWVCWRQQHCALCVLFIARLSRTGTRSTTSQGGADQYGG